MLQVKEGPKLYEQVVDWIKNRIIQGIYQKGNLLPSEKELTELTGVSRITVREALRLLNEAGVIETRKGKGSYVMVDAGELQCETDTGENYKEMFLHSTDARILMEPAVVRELAVSASDQALRQIAETLEKKGSDEDFHYAVVKALGDPILVQWYEQLYNMEAAPAIVTLVPPVSQKRVAARITQQHQDICRALLARDGEFAYFYMKEHLKYIRSIYQEHFKVFY